MNIKSLLLGSAAALAAVSGAQAADAIVAAEPEPMEYVRVCDAFGTGYFYIPGTETCLKIGGLVRFQVDFGQDVNGFNDYDWDTFSRVELNLTAKSDTELGTLTSVASVRVEANQDIGYASNITNGGGSGINDGRIMQVCTSLSDWMCSELVPGNSSAPVLTAGYYLCKHVVRWEYGT
jgi:opacity protein-like surface antigen